MTTTTAATTKLAREIQDEFLICKICLEIYKSPKCLSCMHTFCAACIENHIVSEATYKKYCDYRDFTCPLCRKRTQLPVGGVRKLADNFLVSSLSEVVSRQRPPKYPLCDFCKLLAGRERDASTKCLDCVKMLCAACTCQHRQTRVTSSHSLVDVDIEKDIECKEHPDEVVRYYCEACDQCVCILCTFHGHKEHEISELAEAVIRYKEHIGDLLRACRDKVERFDDNSRVVARCEDAYREAEQGIHDTAIKFIQDIRVRERQLVEELRNVYGPACMDYLDHRKDMACQMETLRNTCNLTELVLGGKSIELLLLKSDVEEKLASLGDVVVRDVPPTVDKVVQYVTGSVDMGYIYDPSRPLMSSMPPPTNKIYSAPSHQSETNGATEDNYFNGLAAARARSPYPPNDSAAAVKKNSGVTEATQTEKNEGVATVSRGVQTDAVVPPVVAAAPTASPTPSRVHSFFRRPEASTFSKPARFG